MPAFIHGTADILNVRHRTTQIVETPLTVNGSRTFRFIDVGGQRGNRKRWIPYFDDVNTILFIVSLAGFDQCLVEDPTVNRMSDSLALFETIFHHKLLGNASIILFLNKKDLFEVKLKESAISAYFPDFDSTLERNAKAGLSFFKKKFKHACNGLTDDPAGRKLYTHATTITDSKSMSVIISAVIDGILLKSVKSGGFIL
ncbi:guanine nucleotide binding protein, alpha subunit [Entophlyctis helioformis]|nr:guanine nucleotide binding protein, alpha subunit [Entophlyctis helioformis]